MAGFQLTQLEKYLKILVQDLNKHVAICTEFPEYVDGKLQSPIPRRVTRIITPGTLIDEGFMEQDKNNFLLSVHHSKSERDVKSTVASDAKDTIEEFGLAWIDISTGEFFLQTTDRASLFSSLLRIDATEVVVSDHVSSTIKDQIVSYLGLSPQRVASPSLDSDPIINDDSRTWMHRLDQPLSTEESTDISELEHTACNQLLQYIDTHLLESKLKPQRPQRINSSDNMSIDRSSIRGLELLKTARDGLGKGSLINTIQRTVTKGGSRLLRERLTYPSVIPGVIEYRLDLVSAFLSESLLHQTVLIHLRDLFDIHKLVQKFALDRGYAEDLLRLARSIQGVQNIVQLLASVGSDTSNQRQAFTKLISQIDMVGPQHLCAQIGGSIDEQGLRTFMTQDSENPAEEADTDTDSSSATSMDEALSPTDSARNGFLRSPAEKPSKEDPWIMQKGASVELEALHAKLEDRDQKRIELQEDLRERLSAPRLTLKNDPKFGYICQAPKSKSFDESALRELGTELVGNMRTIISFYVAKWSKLGREMDNLKSKIRNEEQKMLQRLRQLVVENIVPLRQNASAMDELDVAASFATLALDEEWVRPLITTRPIHTIVGGRHPTVKQGLQDKGQSFVSNDLSLDRKARAWLITGPNMAGKSTFLRQNALITILAQIGSYVPAEYAEIGVVDKIFSRIGAADDLFRNESTFMVEMLETASILRDATDRSFVIMDEVGRGTAPEDGTAVAYASLHHLYHTNRCRTLFATHFHDLAEKTAEWPELAQYCTDVYEDESGAFTFVHKLRPGVNKKSHALRVAKMAGLPAAALQVAQNMLDENKDMTGVIEQV